MPGHMGDVTVTIQNLEIVEVNPNENYILISGNIPGAKDSLVLIKSAVKNSRKENPKELISYEEETVVENNTEEIKSEETKTEEVEKTETPVAEAKEEVKETEKASK